MTSNQTLIFIFDDQHFRVTFIFCLRFDNKKKIFAQFRETILNSLNDEWNKWLSYHLKILQKLLVLEISMRGDRKVKFFVGDSNMESN